MCYEYVEYLISIKFQLHRFWYRQDTPTIKFTILAQLIVNLVHAASPTLAFTQTSVPNWHAFGPALPNLIPSLSRIPFGMKIWPPKKKARDL